MWDFIYGWSAPFTVSRTTVISHPDMPPITAFWSECPSRARGLNRINNWDYLESPGSLYLGLFNLHPHSAYSFRHHSSLKDAWPSVHLYCAAALWDIITRLSKACAHSLKDLNSNQTVDAIVPSAVSRSSSAQTIALIWMCFVSGSNFSHSTATLSQVPCRPLKQGSHRHSHNQHDS